MKNVLTKFFFLIAFLSLSLLSHAAVININTETADALRVALHGASDGDEIVMAAGTYVESNSNFIAFDGKNVLVRAAEGAEVIIQPQVPITVANGGCAHFQNVKIDASHLNDIESWYEHIIYAQDAVANNRIILEGCEIYNFALNKSLISCPSASALDALTINNSYFHNIHKSCVFVENNTNPIDVTITNSTFANITTDANSYSAGVIDLRAASSQLLVDHCTFYDVIPMNTDYSCVSKITLANGVVSNCIFMLPSAQDGIRAMRGVTANNCLTYNYLKDSGTGIHSSVTQNNCFQADPIFADAANGDFSLAGNWVTMNISPARGAATDGSDLGDPRWAVAETLPTTDFATPYAFIGSKAIVSDHMELDANNYIHSKSSGGSALWKIHAERACDVQVTLNMDPDGEVIGHNYQVEIFDANGTSIGALDEGGWSNNVDDKVLSGKIHFPAVGDYSIELSNGISGTSSTIKGITLAFAGGAVFDIPTTLLPADATLSEYAEINGDGELVFSTRDWLVLEQFGKWNIHVEKGGNYAFQLNAKSTNGHSYKVSILTADESETLQYFEKTGSYGVDLSATEILTLTPGDYVVKVQNTTNYSAGRLVNIIITYEGGGTITLPNALEADDAIFSTKAYADAGEIYFSPDPSSQNVLGEWAKWNVNVAASGTFLFTLNVTSTNSQTYKITILDGDDEIDSFEKHPSSGDQTLKHYFNLAAGNYIVKVENSYSWSKGHVVSLVVTEPSLLTIDENATNNSVIHNNYRQEAQDIKIIRTIVPNMYNTICLPFDVSSADLTAIFGSDVELKQMSSATLSGEELELMFDAATSIYRGTPYLIKTSKQIVNPVFADAIIKEENAQATAGDNVDFIGTFIKGTIPAGESNLFLGPNNTLYFSPDDTPIQGLRAWFRVNVPGASNVIKRARIVTQGNTTTEIDLVGKQNAIIKTIENGQVVIIRDGIRYNTIGQRLD